MPQEYYCQMSGYDDPEDWAIIQAYDEEHAATEYAKVCDNRSGGEILQDAKGSVVIRVKRGGNKPTDFEVTAEYSKDFYASEK